MLFGISGYFHSHHSLPLIDVWFIASGLAFLFPLLFLLLLVDFNELVEHISECFLFFFFLSFNFLANSEPVLAALFQVPILRTSQ